MGLEPLSNKIIFDGKQRLKNIYRIEFEAKIARMCKTRGLLAAANVIFVSCCNRLSCRILRKG